MQALRHIVGALLLCSCVFAPFTGAARAGAEQKLEGLVLRTNVTLCQLKPRGCAGYFVLETERGSRRERVTVQVRLGVPIRHEDDYVFLASLSGNLVSVTYVSEKGAIVARSIVVLYKAAR